MLPLVSLMHSRCFLSSTVARMSKENKGSIGDVLRMTNNVLGKRRECIREASRKSFAPGFLCSPKNPNLLWEWQGTCCESLRMYKGGITKVLQTLRMSSECVEDVLRKIGFLLNSFPYASLTLPFAQWDRYLREALLTRCEYKYSRTNTRDV